MAQKFVPPTSKPTSREVAAARPKLLVKLAEKFHVDADKMLSTLKATAFHSDKEVSNEQMMALLIVADQFNLNPWTKEIYAFVDRRSGAVIPVIGVDGWIRIVNEHPQFAALTFAYPDVADDEVAPWIECSIRRKDRDEPTTLREYFAECRRNTDPWNSHPRRMLRHKALVQCARVAFGFAGVYDPDEAERIREAINVTPRKVKPETMPPQALEGNGEPAKATPDQIAMIRDALEQGQIAPSECHEQFGIENLEALPFDKVPEVLSWAKKHAPAGEA